MIISKNKKQYTTAEKMRLRSLALDEVLNNIAQGAELKEAFLTSRHFMRLDHESKERVKNAYFKTRPAAVEEYEIDERIYLQVI